MKSPNFLITALGALALALLPPSVLRAETASPTVNVGTSILPHQYIVQRIGGERVKVTALVAPGQNPHTFDPSAKQVGELAKCKLLFGVDMPFEEKVLEKLKSLAPDLKVVDLQEGITMRRFTDDELEAHEAEEGHGHGHEHADHDHDHGHGHEAEKHAGHDEATDPHTWMSPRNMIVQATAIAKALTAVDPAGAEVFTANLTELVLELNALDKELAESLAPIKGKELLVYHPAFGYFADAYGLKQVAVETGGREPNAKQLRTLIKRAKASGARVVFVQPQFAKSSAQALAEQIGGTVVPLDDLGEDYLVSLREVAKRVRENVGQ